MTTIDPYASTPEEAPSKPEGAKKFLNPFTLIVVAAIMLLIGVVAWGIYQNEQDTLDDGPAPEFSLTIYNSNNIAYSDPNMVMDYSGETFNLDDFKGKHVLVINLWQSNCVPCHQEADMLVEVYNDYRDQGVIFLGINAKDPDKLAYEYIVKYNINYPNGLDRGDKFQDDYRTTGYPETFIIDLEGHIQLHINGPISENQLRDEIDKALGL
ncbi:MAG: TlpA family protein disulfide reductase [Anaerolineales bacterium]|nr:TlpA family protein disulfide reductase [Anaerolineales bacterium]